LIVGRGKRGSSDSASVRGRGSFNLSKIEEQLRSSTGGRWSIPREGRRPKPRWPSQRSSAIADGSWNDDLRW